MYAWSYISHGVSVLIFVIFLSFYRTLTETEMRRQRLCLKPDILRFYFKIGHDLSLPNAFHFILNKILS